MEPNSWRNIMEWRQNPDDYRWLILVLRDEKGSNPFWQVEGEVTQPQKKKDWVVENKKAPVPIGKWFKLEVFWKAIDQNDGRVLVKIDGQTIADYKGRTKNSAVGWSKWNIFKVYTGANSLAKSNAYQWIDDVEIWSDFPGTGGHAIKANSRNLH